MGGDSYGASLANSASSGASLSGATDASGGGVYGGITYGPGSVVTASGNGTNTLLWVALAAAGVGVLFILKGK